MGVRPSRHAKNELRRLRATRQEVESVVENPIRKDFDDKGNALYFGYLASAPVWIVVADDDPDVIITVFEEGRR
jgi:hypothetical protein